MNDSRNPRSKKMPKDKKAIREERIKNTINQVIEIFQEGNVPKAISMVTFPPYQNIPSNKWSLCNRLIMMKAGTSDLRGFKQWKESGRSVKKGAKAIYILSPRMVKKKKDAKESREETNENVSEEKKFFLVGFTPIPLFKVEDTDGEPLEYKEHELPDLPLMEKAREWGIDVSPLTFQGKFYGYFKSGIQEEIRLASPNEVVFFHELAHAAHKRIKGEIQARHKAKEEIVAELSAQVLSQLVGIEVESTLGNSYEYISHYAKNIQKDIGSACLSVIADVEKILKLILEKDSCLVEN